MRTLKQRSPAEIEGERRSGRPAGWSGELPCRSCGEIMRLDVSRMEHLGGEWWMPCAACGASFRVREEDHDLEVAWRAAAAGPVLPAPVVPRRRLPFARRSGAR